MDGGFFKGTTSEQDSRFSNKTLKLMKQMKFSNVLDTKIDMHKVDIEAIKPWINQRMTELLGFEDDVVVSYILNQLEPQYPNPKEIQVNLTGFLNAKTSRLFLAELWNLLISGLESQKGVPVSLIEAHLKEIKNNQEDETKIKNQLREETEKYAKILEEEKSYEKHERVHERNYRRRDYDDENSHQTERRRHRSREHRRSGERNKPPRESRFQSDAKNISTVDIVPKENTAIISDYTDFEEVPSKISPERKPNEGRKSREPSETIVKKHNDRRSPNRNENRKRFDDRERKNHRDSGGLHESNDYRHRDNGPRGKNEHNRNMNELGARGDRNRPDFEDRDNRKKLDNRDRNEFKGRDRNDFHGRERNDFKDRNELRDRNDYRDRNEFRNHNEGRNRNDYRDRNEDRNRNEGRERNDYRDRGGNFRNDRNEWKARNEGGHKGECRETNKDEGRRSTEADEEPPRKSVTLPAFEPEVIKEKWTCDSDATSEEVAVPTTKNVQKTEEKSLKERRKSGYESDSSDEVLKKHNIGSMYADRIGTEGSGTRGRRDLGRGQKRRLPVSRIDNKSPQSDHSRRKTNDEVTVQDQQKELDKVVIKVESPPQKWNYHSDSAEVRANKPASQKKSVEENRRTKDNREDRINCDVRPERRFRDNSRLERRPRDEIREERRPRDDIRDERRPRDGLRDERRPREDRRSREEIREEKWSKDPNREERRPRDDIRGDRRPNFNRDRRDRPDMDASPVSKRPRFQGGRIEDVECRRRGRRPSQRAAHSPAVAESARRRRPQQSPKRNRLRANSGSSEGNSALAMRSQRRPDGRHKLQSRDTTVVAADMTEVDRIARRTLEEQRQQRQRSSPASASSSSAGGSSSSDSESGDSSSSNGNSSSSSSSAAASSSSSSHRKKRTGGDPRNTVPHVIPQKKEGSSSTQAEQERILRQRALESLNRLHK